MRYPSSQEIQAKIDKLNKRLTEAKARENIHFVSDQLIERLKQVLKPKGVFLTTGEIGHIVNPIRQIEENRFKQQQKKKIQNDKYKNNMITEQENV